MSRLASAIEAVIPPREEDDPWRFTVPSGDGTIELDIWADIADNKTTHSSIDPLGYSAFAEAF